MTTAEGKKLREDARMKERLVACFWEVIASFLSPFKDLVSRKSINI